MSETIYYKEGEIYEFIIKKEIHISDDENYYVLQDHNGRKQLLNSEFYKKYNFKIGQEIFCRIDHINCAGKIFLEPKHPFYDEGETYSFKISETKIVKNRLDKDVLQIGIFGKNNIEATCKIENFNNKNFIVGSFITCRVELIKKAKLYLTYIDVKSSFNLEKGKSYKFKIEDVKILTDNFKYYILSDDLKNTHLLRHEYYENHNLKIGTTIECDVLKFSSENYYILEPKHPYYELDTEYKFCFIKQEKSASSKHTGNYEITVKDVFNNDIVFTSSINLKNNNTFPNKIKCRITGVKKGKALLAIV